MFCVFGVIDDNSNAVFFPVDKTVSRAHAKCNIGTQYNKKKVVSLPEFTVTDCKSTFGKIRIRLYHTWVFNHAAIGTFVNGIKIQPNVATALKDGDLLTFGANDQNNKNLSPSKCLPPSKAR